MITTPRRLSTHVRGYVPAEAAACWHRRTRGPRRIRTSSSSTCPQRQGVAISWPTQHLRRSAQQKMLRDETRSHLLIIVWKWQGCNQMATRAFRSLIMMHTTQRICRADVCCISHVSTDLRNSCDLTSKLDEQSACRLHAAQTTTATSPQPCRDETKQYEPYQRWS